MKLNYVPFKTKRRRFNGNHKTIFILTSTDLPLKKEFFPILRNVYKRERNQETTLGEIKKNLTKARHLHIRNVMVNKRCVVKCTNLYKLTSCVTLLAV